MIVKVPKHSRLNQLCQLQSLTIAIKHHSTCDEAGMSETAIATNALVKDFCVTLQCKVDKVAPGGN
jgi:hypothetical protein